MIDNTKKYNSLEEFAIDTYIQLSVYEYWTFNQNMISEIDIKTIYENMPHFIDYPDYKVFRKRLIDCFDLLDTNENMKSKLRSIHW